jgi:gamma-glutamyl hydrolase
MLSAILALFSLSVRIIPNSSPLIGIYPCDNTSGNLLAYQSWVEQFGAQTLILPKNATEMEMERLFRQINGLLLPGMMLTKPSIESGPEIPPLVTQLIQRATTANQIDHDFFPLWTTCLGFEWLIETIGGKKVITRGFNSTNFAQSLSFTQHAPGRMFASANTSLAKWLTTENITYNDHMGGLRPREERLNPPLEAMFNVLATSVDRQGKPFVAAFEGKELPFYGTQFHPEHIQFIKGSGIPKTPEAVAAARFLGEFFVNEAAKNTHTH